MQVTLHSRAFDDYHLSFHVRTYVFTEVLRTPHDGIQNRTTPRIATLKKKKKMEGVKRWTLEHWNMK